MRVRLMMCAILAVAYSQFCLTVQTVPISWGAEPPGPGGLSCLLFPWLC